MSVADSKSGGSSGGSARPAASASGGSFGSFGDSKSSGDSKQSSDSKSSSGGFAFGDFGAGSAAGSAAGGAGGFEFRFGDDAKIGSGNNSKLPSVPTPQMPAYTSGAAASAAAAKAALFTLPLPPLDLGRCQTSESLAVAMSRFWGQDKYSDVVFVVGTTEATRRRVPAHSLLLAARSPIFERMLFPPAPASSAASKPAAASASGDGKSDTKSSSGSDDVTGKMSGLTITAGPSKPAASTTASTASGELSTDASGKREILITDCEANLFVRMLECVYTDKMDGLVAEELSAVTEMAKKYHLECVKRVCSKFFKEKLSHANACTLLDDDRLTLADSQHGMCVSVFLCSLFICFFVLTVLLVCDADVMQYCIISNKI